MLVQSSVAFRYEIAPARNGMGTKWDGHEMGRARNGPVGNELALARNGIGMNWVFFEIYNISRARYGSGMGPKWDGPEMAWAQNGTGTKWDSQARIGTGTKWDRHKMAGHEMAGTKWSGIKWLGTKWDIPFHVTSSISSLIN